MSSPGDDEVAGQAASFLLGHDKGKDFVVRFRDFVDAEVKPLLETTGTAEPKSLSDVVHAVAALFRETADSLERAVDGQ